jgi:protein-S-isoprenylcysteine O-methyltransferase Ste14
MPPSPPGRTFAWFAGALFAASLAFFVYAYFVQFKRPAPAGGWIEPSIVNLLLFTAFALHHSLVVRPRVRDAVSRRIPAHLDRALYTATASVLFLLVCWLWRPVPGEAYRLGAPWSWLATAVQVSGVWLTVVGSRAMDPLELAGIRQALQAPHGSPAHVPLQTRGAYRFVRHPIYLGWVLLVFGAPEMTGTRLVFAIASTLYLVVAVPLEERALVARFGNEYRRYQRRVPWRIVPGIY